MKVLIGPTPALPMAIPDLQKEFPHVQFETFMDVPDLAAAIADADAYAGMITRDQFLAAKKLQWIQSPSTGVDFYLVIPELAASDVRLTSARGTHTACVAESTMAMILGITRGVVEAVKYQQKHEWGFFQIRGHLVELTGSTFGLIGLGAIGRAIAKRAHAFEMRVIAVDINTANKPDFVDELWGLERLNDLLKQADYVVVTVPGTPNSKGLIGEKEIAQMKPTAMLLGISRGGVVDQDALLKALKEKKIGAAALDVFVPEPLPADSELWDMPNLLITAHISGGTQYESQYVFEILRENLGKFVRHDLPLRNQVDKRLGF